MQGIVHPIFAATYRRTLFGVAILPNPVRQKQKNAAEQGSVVRKITIQR
jgi:hypothetical protein